MYNIYGKKITLRKWQKEAVEHLSAHMDGGHLLAVVAPTGAGKTPVAYEMMRRGLREGRRVIYASPLKAISNERFMELKYSLLEGVEPGIITGDVDVNTSSQLLMVTTEILRNSPSLMRHSLVVFDEVHYVSINPDRARTFAEVLLMMGEADMDSVPMLLTATLAPTREEMDDVLEFLASLAGKKPVLYVHDKRPVPLKVPKKPFVMKKLRRALVFVNSYKEAFEVAKKLSTYRVPVRSRWKRFKEILEDVGGERSGYIRAKLIKRGIGIHHGNLLPGEKIAMEIAFREGVVDVVVGTTTLAYGVNMPADVVVFYSSRRYDGTPYTANEFLQMAGRAGRPGLSDVGLVGGFKKSVHKWVARMLKEAKPSFVLLPQPSPRPFVEAVHETGKTDKKTMRRVARQENAFLASITYGAEPMKVFPSDYKRVATILLTLSGQSGIPIREFAGHVLWAWGDELIEGWREGRSWFFETGIPYVVNGWNGVYYEIDAYPLIALPLLEEKMEKGGISGKTLYSARQRLKWLKSIKRRNPDLFRVVSLEEAEDVVENVDPLKERLEVAEED